VEVSDVPQRNHISALPEADPETLDEDLPALYALCRDELGIVPNVLRAYSLRPQKSSSERWLRSSSRS
jgi:hypothetical protein